jgi:hypothetical protein
MPRDHETQFTSVGRGGRGGICLEAGEEKEMTDFGDCRGCRLVSPNLYTPN